MQEYLDRGPGFIFCTHPAVGPLWDVTEQKISGGALADRAEVRLEIAEVQWRDVRVDGSLLVEADAPLGGDPAGLLAASRSGDDAGAVVAFDDGGCGRCRLRDVTVTNRQGASNVRYTHERPLHTPYTHSAFTFPRLASINSILLTLHSPACM